MCRGIRPAGFYGLPLCPGLKMGVLAVFPLYYQRTGIVAEGPQEQQPQLRRSHDTSRPAMQSRRRRGSSFYDSVRVGLARQDEGVENFGVTRTIGCLIRIIDTQARK